MTKKLFAIVFLLISVSIEAVESPTRRSPKHEPKTPGQEANRAAKSNRVARSLSRTGEITDIGNPRSTFSILAHDDESTEDAGSSESDSDSELPVVVVGTFASTIRSASAPVGLEGVNAVPRFAPNGKPIRSPLSLGALKNRRRTSWVTLGSPKRSSTPSVTH